MYQYSTDIYGKIHVLTHINTTNNTIIIQAKE